MFRLVNGIAHFMVAIFRHVRFYILIKYARHGTRYALSPGSYKLKLTEKDGDYGGDYCKLYLQSM